MAMKAPLHDLAMGSPIDAAAPDLSVTIPLDGGAPDDSGPPSTDDAANQSDDGGPVTIVAPARPSSQSWNQLALFQTDGGTLTMISLPGVSLNIDPTLRTPITALADCTAMITQCFSPPNRTLDACVAAAPLCQTNQPWTEATPCCPSDCRDAFQSARKNGADNATALDQSYFMRPGCFPGIAAAP